MMCYVMMVMIEINGFSGLSASLHEQDHHL